MITARIKAVLFGFALLTLLSCEFEDDNNGYPQEVTFSYAGGEQIVSGDDFFWNLEIEDGGDAVAAAGVDENDSIIVHHDWLTAKTRFSSKRLILIAEPSSDHKSRSLTLIGHFGKEYATIKVCQK